MSGRNPALKIATFNVIDFGGDPGEDPLAQLRMGDDEAWLLGDASDEDLASAGHGPAIDSRGYGPVPIDALVARAWFRYGPSPRRIGRLPARRR